MTEKHPQHRADCTGEVWAVSGPGPAGWWLLVCTGCGTSRLVRTNEEGR